MAVKRPTYSSKSVTVRLIGLATVTAGGDGAPACFWLSPQLVIKTANAHSKTTRLPPRINENDGIARAKFMNTCDIGRPRIARTFQIASGRGYVHQRVSRAGGRERQQE